MLDYIDYEAEDKKVAICNNCCKPKLLITNFKKVFSYIHFTGLHFSSTMCVKG